MPSSVSLPMLVHASRDLNTGKIASVPPSHKNLIFRILLSTDTFFGLAFGASFLLLISMMRTLTPFIALVAHQAYPFFVAAIPSPWEIIPRDLRDNPPLDILDLNARDTEPSGKQSLAFSTLKSSAHE